MNHSLGTLLRVVATLMAISAVSCTLNAQGQTSFVYTNDNVPNGANTVTAFAVGSNGALTLIATYPTGGTGASNGLYASNRVTVRTVGSFLYVSNDGSNNVSAFSINPSTGVLTAVPGSPFATGGNSGTMGGISLAETPGGGFLIAGNWGSQNATVFSIAADGSLSQIAGSPFSVGGAPDGMKISPDGAFLATGFYPSATVGVLGVAPNGVLAPVPGSPFAGSVADAGVDISCSGNRLFAGNANLTTTYVDVFNMGVNGSLSPIPGSPFGNEAGVGTNSNVVLLNPNQQFLFVSNQNSDQITVFAVASNGSLTPISGSPFAVGSGGSPSLMAMDQTGTFLFTANYPGTSGASIGAFTIASNGVPTPVSGSPFPVQGSFLESIAVFPSATCGNPVPLINEPLVPDASPAGGPGFTLTVNGSGFVSSSAVNWNGTPLATTFVTRNQLTATVPASNIATAGTASVTVTNPAPGGGTSDVELFTITSPTPSLTFATSTDSVQISPNSAVVADFNHDGRPDLAVVNNCGTDSSCASPGSVSILLGNGNGTFTTKSTPLVGQMAYAAAVGDFNGDGIPDLVVGSNCSSGVCFGTVSILLGNGDGTFTPRYTYDGETYGIQSIAAGDFNGDGKLDLAFVNSNSDGGYVSILLGNGDGTFTFGSTAGFGPTLTSVVTGDFNGDGILDLAVTDAPPSPGVTILLGNGDGTFTAASSQPFTTLVAPQSVTTGDFNGDGILDLAFADAGSGILTVLQGNGDGTFNQVSGEPVSSQYSVFLRTADFNGDNKPDLAVVGFCGGLVNCSPVISIYLGNGDGTFQGGLNTAAGNLPLGLAFGDFNSDGRLDLAVANSKDNTVSVLLQSPAASLTPPTLAFGKQLINTTSNPQQATLTNTGSATLNITGISIIGANSTDFAENSDCSTVLAAGANCTIDVAFTPKATGQRSATLAVYDNASGSPQTVSLSGTGVKGPIIQTQPASQTINYNQTATLTVVATGTPPLSYQWYLGMSPDTSNPIAGATNSSYTTPPLTITTDYWVQVSNAEGKANSTTAIVTVNPPPRITTTSLPGGTVGTAYSQTLQATGGTPPYVWSITVGSLPAGLALNASSGVISGIPTTAGTSTFTVQVTDANSNIATQPLGIRIVSLVTLPMITTQPASQMINRGQTATLTVVATGTAPLSYQWYQGVSPDTTSPISGATSASFTTPALTTTTSFWVKVSNAAGSVNSTTATVTVDLGPVCTLAVQGTSNPLEFQVTTNCSDATATITSTTINWGDGTAETSGTSGSHTYTNAGAYTITVTAIDTLELVGTALESVTAIQQPPQSAFAGQSSSGPVTVIPPSQSVGAIVTFDCTTVTGSGLSAPVTAASLGISCSSAPVKLVANTNTVPVSISTTGSAAALMSSPLKRVWPLYAVWLPLPGFVFLGLGISSSGPNRRRLSRYLALVGLSVLVALLMSCGGGFTPPSTPSKKQGTPAGTYSVTLVDTPVQGATTSFVQTSLIVPLTVSATQ